MTSEFIHSTRLLVQQFVYVNSNENIKAPHNSFLWGESAPQNGQYGGKRCPNHDMRVFKNIPGSGKHLEQFGIFVIIQSGLWSLLLHIPSDLGNNSVQ